MAAHNFGLTMTIASGQTTTAALSTLLSAGQLKTLLGTARLVAISAPTTLTGACKPEVVGAEGGSVWTNVEINTTFIDLPADTTQIFPAGGFRDLRIISDGAEGADRAFLVNFQVETD